jgi:hypothetical protein
MIFPSKIDWWLGAILALVGLGMSGGGFYGVAYSLLQPGAPLVGAVVGFLPTFLGLLVLWQLLATRYEITSTKLILRSGPFRWTVALHQIMEVYPTWDPPEDAPGYSLVDHFRANHPALSLDRLRVNYRSKGGDYFYLISPRDQAGFLQELAQADPDLLVSGDRIVRVFSRKDAR